MKKIHFKTFILSHHERTQEHKVPNMSTNSTISFWEKKKKT